VQTTVGTTTVSTTFSDVSQLGTTTVTPITPALVPEIPGSFTLQTDGAGQPMAYNIETETQATGPIHLCFQVNSVSDPNQFALLRVLHGEGGQLVDRTYSLDFASRTVCALVDSLSPFLVVQLGTLPITLSDQKAGSVLVFPYYTSDVNGNFARSDTLITLTNVSNGDATAATGAPNHQYLHLFFMKDCSPADTFVCLTPNGSLQFRASEFDPLTTGYLIAVAVDERGVPVRNNSFVGSAFVRDDVNGVIDSYGAEAFAKLNPDPAPVAGGVATLAFDAVGYEAAPVQFAAQVQDPARSDQTIVLASVSGDLGERLAATAQSGPGALYKDDERLASFAPALGEACFISRAVTGQNFRVVPGPLNNFLKDGFGYLRFGLTSPAVGLILSRQGGEGEAKNRFSGIRALHVTATTGATLTLPVFPPACQ
jgi:hypothetical protein